MDYDKYKQASVLSFIVSRAAATLLPDFRSRRTMRVPMKTIGDEVATFEVEAEPTDTIGALKTKVRAKLRGLLKTDCVQLLYGGEWLADHRRLKEVGVDGRFFVGVEVICKQGYASMTIGRAGTQKQPVERSVSLKDLPGTTDRLQVVEQEPLMEDDIFDTFRYLTAKYYRWRGEKKVSKETRRYKTSWAMSKTQMNELDRLVEMGFRRPIAVQVYNACDRNLNAAANVLASEAQP